MGFKEIIQEDIHNIFLDPEEFGAFHQVNGQKMAIVIDDSEVIERSKKQIERTEGVYKRQFLFFVAQKDFGRFPAIGSRIEIDGKSYRIVDAVNEGYMYSITVGSLKS